jgi:AcrR family transcriptional regulator
MLDVSHEALTGDARLDGSPAYRAAAALIPGVSPAPTAASPAGAFVAARRRYLAGERIDMRALAGELGVSRPTLYRWTGPREQLLADILFALSDAAFEAAIRDTSRLTGAPRLLAVFRRHVAAIVSSPPLQTFLRQETQVALRILTGRHASVNPRTVRRVAGLYRAEAQAGHFAPHADIDTLAFAVVCLAESFIYNDASAALEPEVDRAAAVVALLLGVEAEPGVAVEGGVVSGRRR